MKEEGYLDFGLATTDNVQARLDQYDHCFNHKRASAALDDKSPVPYKIELGF